MKFYSKAQTLSKLKIKGAIIPNLLIFWNKDFKKDKKKVLQKISKTFKKERIINIWLSK